jgi:hypothetical protein
MDSPPMGAIFQSHRVYRPAFSCSTTDETLNFSAEHAMNEPRVHRLQVGIRWWAIQGKKSPASGLLPTGQ